MDKQQKKKIEAIARKNGVSHIDGASVLIIDHDQIRQNYRKFRAELPRVQPYFAVKANSLPEIVKTVFDMGGSFDVASYPEFMMVNRLLKDLDPKQRQEYIWENIIYAHPVKEEGTLKKLNRYHPLVTYDSVTEIDKIKQYAPNAGLILRIWCSNRGSVVELSNKFGAPENQAVELVSKAIDAGLVVEGLSFHVGSQCKNFENYTEALECAYDIFNELDTAGLDVGHKKRGENFRVLDLGGGFPVRYGRSPSGFDELAKLLNERINRLFKEKDGFELIAEPGRFMVASAGTLVARITGIREQDDKACYFINDGVYHTFSGKIFDHIDYALEAFKHGKNRTIKVFGQTCDGFDVVERAARLPRLELGDLVYTENIGAYSNASSTRFNGFRGAKIVHINQ